MIDHITTSVDALCLGARIEQVGAADGAIKMSGKLDVSARCGRREKLPESCGDKGAGLNAEDLCDDVTVRQEPPELADSQIVDERDVVDRWQG